MRRPSACAFFMLNAITDNHPMPKLFFRLPALLVFLLSLTYAPAAQTAKSKDLKPTGSYWLFAGFKDNSEDGVFYALSSDGYHWTLANQGKPVLHQTEPNELMRDPFVQRGPDGTFQMVWTWSWRTPTLIGHSTSTDLFHCTSHHHLAVVANKHA